MPEGRISFGTEQELDSCQGFVSRGSVEVLEKDLVSTYRRLSTFSKAVKNEFIFARFCDAGDDDEDDFDGGKKVQKGGKQ